MCVFLANWRPTVVVHPPPLVHRVQQNFFGNEDTKSRALDKVELLCSKAQPPSIEKVWLALQEVVGGAEDLSAHRRDRVELAMVRNRGESPTHLATLIVDAAGL